MMRSLYTAASGMKTQQAMVDSISNNISNVNTTGFKKERLEFKSLLYETMKEAGEAENGGAPVNLQVGHGVKYSSSVKQFGQGTLLKTDNPLDLMIEGKGFFVIKDPNGEDVYTRNGSLKLSVVEEGIVVTNDAGLPYMNTEGEKILFEDINASELIIDTDGSFSIMKDGQPLDLNQKIQVVQFRNPQGLKSIGGTSFKSTTASGEKMLEGEDDRIDVSTIRQGGLEASNVQAVEEMVKLIVAQRAYELNSKAIQTSDSMLEQANQLKR